MRTRHAVAKFVTLAAALLLLMFGVSNLVYRTPMAYVISACCAVIAAYAMTVFFEVYKVELTDRVIDERDRSV